MASSPVDQLTLLACQIEIPPMTTAKQRDEHLTASATKVRQKLKEEKEKKNSVDLVVLPELSSIDYSRETFDCLAVIAEPLDGPSFQTWQEVAREFGVFVSYSFARHGEKTMVQGEVPNDPIPFFITISVVGPDGHLVGHYDKMHLAHYGASMEKDYFQRGDHLFTFEVKGFLLAPIICYDIRFPELTRTLVVDHKVDAILHCGAYYRDPSFHTWHPFATTRALENQAFFLSLNRAGENYGNSLFCWPWLDENTSPVTFSDRQEDFKVISLNRAMLETARTDYSFLKDRLKSYNLPVVLAGLCQS